MNHFRRRLREREAARRIDEELRDHIERRKEALLADGMDPERANQEAYRLFGDVGAVHDRCSRIGPAESRTRYRGGLMQSILQDVRYAMRSFGRNPAVVGAIVLTFALGIGANTAIFAVVDAMMLRPLPFGSPDELVHVWRVDDEGALHVTSWRNDALALKREADFFDGVALFGAGPFSLVRLGDGEPERVTVKPVSANLFDVLQVSPVLGRTFTREDTEGGQLVVVLTHEYWSRAFANGQDVLGTSLRLGGDVYTVVGVMDRDYRFDRIQPDMWVAMSDDATVASQDVPGLNIVARLPEGVARSQAQERLSSLAGALRESQVELHARDFRVQPVDVFRVNPNVQRALWVLSCAVGLMLLLATVNIVHLLLAHGTARRGEFVVRTSLGASRARLARQLVTEIAALAVLSAAVSWVFASFALRGIMSIAPSDLTVYAPNVVSLDSRSVWFVAGITVCLVLAIGVMIVIGVSRLSHNVGAATNRLAGQSRGHRRLRSMIVITEIATSMMLLVGAAALIGSFARLLNVDNGYDAEGVLEISLGSLASTHPDRTQRQQLRDEVLTRIRLLPNVVSAAATVGTPPSTSFSYGVQIEAEGRPASDQQPSLVPFAQVQPEFFDILRMQFVSGRNFLPTDDPETTVIVDTQMAAYLWGDADPIGRRFRLESDRPWLSVVGVIEDVKLMGPDDREGAFDFFYPLSQNSAASTILIRTAGDVHAAIPMIKQAVYSVDPNQPVTRIEAIRDNLQDAVAQPRFLMTLVTVLSSLALVLAAVGIYGVFAVTVGQRVRELGIRKALGAPSFEMLKMILRDGLRLALIGSMIGVVAALYLSRFLDQLLFETRATDPTILATATIVSLVVAGAACLPAARKAARVDPVEILRGD